MANYLLNGRGRVVRSHLPFKFWWVATINNHLSISGTADRLTVSGAVELSSPVVSVKLLRVVGQLLITPSPVAHRRYLYSAASLRVEEMV